MLSENKGVRSFTMIAAWRPTTQCLIGSWTGGRPGHCEWHLCSAWKNVETLVSVFGVLLGKRKTLYVTWFLLHAVFWYGEILVESGSPRKVLRTFIHLLWPSSGTAYSCRIFKQNSSLTGQNSQLICPYLNEIKIKFYLYLELNGFSGVCLQA